MSDQTMTPDTLPGELWNAGTVNGQRAVEVLRRTERGMWVRTENGEKWVVPWRDDQPAIKVELSLIQQKSPTNDR